MTSADEDVRNPYPTRPDEGLRAYLIHFWINVIRPLIFQRNHHLIAAAERCHALETTCCVRHRHHRTHAIDRVSGAGEIPFATFVRSRLRLLNKMRRMHPLRCFELNLWDRE